MEILFSVGKVYAGNDVRNFLGTGLGKGDYSSKRVKADSARTHLLPRSSSCIHVRARARLHVPIYTPTNRETGGGEWKRVQRTRPARIAIDRQLFLVSSYRCTYRCTRGFIVRILGAECSTEIARWLARLRSKSICVCRVIVAIIADAEKRSSWKMISSRGSLFGVECTTRNG